jgi:hypothetical protein
MKKEKDYGRFLFRATGPRDGERITSLDIVDNLRGELDRLHAMMELLDYAQANPVPPGTSELLRDIWERASWLLDLWPGLKEGRKP